MITGRGYKACCNSICTGIVSHGEERVMLNADDGIGIDRRAFPLYRVVTTHSRLNLLYMYEVCIRIIPGPTADERRHKFKSRDGV
jgi:hypothetical protein